MMKPFFKPVTIIFCLCLLSACGVFLGSDPENNPRGIFDSIWNEFNNTYALFDIKGVNWNSVYDKYVPEISPGMSDGDLFAVCSDMLGELEDAHVSLMSPFGYYNSGGRFDTSNMEPFSLDLIKDNYLNGDHTSAGDGMFEYGTFHIQPSVGYIHISGFAHGENTGGSQDWIKAIDGIIKTLADTDALVLDLRGNRGGLVANVNYIASRFVETQKDYVQVCTKDGSGRNDFSSPVSYTIRPEGSTFTKPIVLITNAQTISGGEWFTLALLSQNHVIHAGSKTCGAFSLSLERFLVNGWTYTVSVQVVRDMKGICHEGIGISPESGHYKNNLAGNMQLGIDDQLEYALSILP